MEAGDNLSAWQIRRWGTNGKRKKLEPSNIVGYTHTIEAFGGYADFTLSLVADSIGKVQAAIRDRIELWDGERRYRGYVTEVNPNEEDLSKFDVVGYGRMKVLSDIVLDVMFVYPTDVDVSIVVGDVMAEVQKYYPDIVVQIEPVGVTIGSFDAQGKTAEECVRGLLDFAEATVRYGFDVDEYGADRFYLRLIDTSGTAEPDIVLGLDHPTVVSKGFRKSISDLFTRAIVKGITPQYPQGLPNGSFEALRRRTDNDGNVLLNPGFESGAGLADWSAGGGTSAKSDQEGSRPRTGNFAIEIDNLGGTLSQEDVTPAIAIREGTDYAFTFYAQPERNFDSGNPPVIRYRVSWLDSLGSVIFYDQDFASCEERYYKKFEVISRTPGAGNDLSGYRVEFEGDSGTFSTGDGGVWIDDVSLADASTLYAVGWGTEVNGSASVQSLIWNSKDAYHGQNCAAIYVSASDNDANDVVLITEPQYLMDVIAGQEVRFYGWYKGFFTTENVPKALWQIHWRTDDNSPVGSPTSVTVDPGTPVGAWTYAQVVDTVPNGATKAVVLVRIRENGGLKFDGLGFQQAAFGFGTYLPEGDLRLTFRSDEVVTALENPEVYDAITEYGVIDRVLDCDASTYDEAKAVAKAALIEAARFVPEPFITFADSEYAFTTYKTVKFIGKGSSVWQDGVMPIIRIQCSIDKDAIRQEEVEFLRKKTLIEDIFRRLQDQASKDRQNNGVGYTSTAASVGGGGVSSGTIGPPGAPGADGNTILNGTGAPGSGLGVDGDFYIDTAANEIYGPKTGGSWGSGTPIGGGGGGGALQAFTYTATSLAHAATDTGTISSAGFACFVTQVTCDVADVWIRVYKTAAQRTADAGRLMNEPPTAGMHGCVMDWVVESGQMTWDMNQFGNWRNSESVFADEMYVSIYNFSGGTADITFSGFAAKVES